MKNKTFIIVIVILVIVSAIGFASYLPSRFDAALKTKVADFPQTIGEWSSTEIQLPERDYQILETRNLFVRDYKNSENDSVYFYLIYSEDNRKVSHPPEVCYMGSGLTIVNKNVIQLTDSIKANKMIAEKADSRQMVVYWLKAGDLYTEKYLTQQIKLAVDRLFGKRTSSALIRLSTDIKNDDEGAAFELIQSFARQIEPLLSKHIP